MMENIESEIKDENHVVQRLVANQPIFQETKKKEM